MGDDALVKPSVPPWRIIVISFVMGAEEGEEKSGLSFVWFYSFA